jgi:hypothetical protein
MIDALRRFPVLAVAAASAAMPATTTMPGEAAMPAEPPMPMRKTGSATQADRVRTTPISSSMVLVNTRPWFIAASVLGSSSRLPAPMQPSAIYILS